MARKTTRKAHTKNLRKRHASNKTQKVVKAVEKKRAKRGTLNKYGRTKHLNKTARKVARKQVSKGRPSLKGVKKKKAIDRRVGAAYPFGYVDTY